nr:hypothetical protein Iba_chr11aCG8730 [Ipomoea batatas]
MSTTVVKQLSMLILLLQFSGFNLTRSQEQNTIINSKNLCSITAKISIPSAQEEKQICAYQEDFRKNWYQCELQLGRRFGMQKPQQFCKMEQQRGRGIRIWDSGPLGDSLIGMATGKEYVPAPDPTQLGLIDSR